MKTLVCGGRNIGRTNPVASSVNTSAQVQRASHERKFIVEKLDSIHAEKGFTQVIGGEEGGAERIALEWARLKNLPVTVIGRSRTKGKVKKGLLGLKMANKDETIFERNSRMLSVGNPDLVIAFGGGEATKLLLSEARQKGVEVMEIEIPTS